MKKKRIRLGENKAISIQDDKVIDLMSQTFSAMSESGRIKIINALLHNELCVNDLTKILGISSSGVSHQLRILRNLRLVKYRKVGKSVLYTLDDKHIENLFKECIVHVQEIL